MLPIVSMLHGHTYEVNTKQEKAGMKQVQFWQLFTCLDYTNFGNFQTSQFW